MSTTREEQRSAFLMKRTEFRTYIRRLAESQTQEKAEFRALKAKTTKLDRQKDPRILNNPRTDIVHARANIRYALLAYAMFRGKPYAKVEQKCKDKPDPYHIWAWFKRLDLGDRYDKAHIELWLTGGTLPRIELPPLPVIELPDMSLELPKAAAGGGP